MLVYQLNRDSGGLLLCEVFPEGQLIYNEVRKYTDALDMATTTIRDALKLLEAVNPDAHKLYMVQQLNSSVEPAKLEQVLLNTRSRGRALLVTSMVAMIIALVACYCVSMVYVAVETGKIPTYADLAIPLLIPGMVIWGYAGLLNKERKDVLAAALGDSPLGNTVIGKVATAFIDSRATQKKE